MSKNENEDKNRSNHDNEYEYFYYKDHEGRIQRIRKVSYQPRPGYIRLKFLEKFYIKYIRSSYDSKLTWLPWLVGYTLCNLGIKRVRQVCLG